MGQGDGLAVIVEHVLDLDLVLLDANDLVPAVDNVALAADEDVVALCQEDALRLSRLVSEAVEL